MALTGVDILQINKALTQNVDSVSINDFYTFAKKSTASLEDVLFYLVKSFIKLLENNDSNYKKMNKLIYHIKAFTMECIRVDEKVEAEFYIKLQAIIDAYNNFQGDKEEIKELMEDFIKFLNDNSPLQNGEDIKVLQKLKEEKDKLAKRIEELENTIVNLNKNISHLNKICERNRAEAEKAKDKSVKSNDMVTQLQQENKTLQENIDTLNNTIALLEQEVSRLKQEINNLEAKIKNISENHEKSIRNLKDQLSASSKKIEEYRTAIEEYENANRLEEEEKSRIKRQERKDEYICEVIINALLASRHKLKDLKKILASLKIDVTDDELNYYLNMIRLRYDIKTSFSHSTAYYEIESPLITKQSLNIDTGKNPEVNFLVLSNMFISSFTANQVKDIELLYDYCSKNGINYIINLGNIFDFTLSKVPTVDDIERFNDILNKILFKYPKDSRIYNLLLGGENEKSILSLGLNPVSLLSKSRSDFVNLGYINSSLIFGTNKNFILLHSVEYNEATTTLPNRNSVTSPYVHLFTANEAGINVPLNSANIPAFSSDSLVRAFHMKISFDPNRKINHIIFMPLIVDKKIVHTASIHYTKYKNKKE